MMLKSWQYKLDPTHYLQLYINKVYDESFNYTKSNVISSSVSSQEGSSKGSFIETDTKSPVVEEFDIIGLTVIEVSAQYKLKFKTLRSHLSFPDHPIVRMLIYFRDIIQEFITESDSKIKQYLQFQHESERAALQVTQYETVLK
jgi:hypothetical protein